MALMKFILKIKWVPEMSVARKNVVKKVIFVCV